MNPSPRPCRECTHWTPLVDDDPQPGTWPNVGYWGECSVHENECYQWDTCDKWETRDET